MERKQLQSRTCACNFLLLLAVFVLYQLWVSTHYGTEQGRIQVRWGHMTSNAPGHVRIADSTGQRQAVSMSELVALFAMIGRDVEHKLPYVLRNIERLGAKFNKSYVLLVENDSTDGTVRYFSKWLQSKRGHFWDGEIRSFNITSERERSLQLMAGVRNKYLEALLEPQYSDVDYLIAVDTDMCNPWDVDKMQQVFENLLPYSGLEWDVLYAYGACKYFSNFSTTDEVRPGSPTGFARYCDLFALKDGQGHRYVIKNQSSYPRLVSRGWRMPVSSSNPAEICSSPDAQAHNCTLLGMAEPVISVQAAFGGLGIYRTEVFTKPHLWTNNVRCQYASDQANDECEHVGLGSCLHTHSVRQLIAVRLVVDWQGCQGPVRDTTPDAGPWFLTCPCADL